MLLFKFANVRRLLLTGTPLQNDLMELFHMLYFLMPDIFCGFAEDFKKLIVDPLNHAIHGNQLDVTRDLVQRMHVMLRPFMLRRLKSEVETKLPSKRECIIMCGLLGRQKVLYEEFMRRRDTQSKLQEGAYFKIMSIAMELRKVCNHPELFQPRRVKTPMTMSPLQLRVPAVVFLWLYAGLWRCLDMQQEYCSEVLRPLLSLCCMELRLLKSSFSNPPVDGEQIILKVPYRQVSSMVSLSRPRFGADGLNLLGSICCWNGGEAVNLCWSRSVKGSDPRGFCRRPDPLWAATIQHRLCLPLSNFTEEILLHRRNLVVCTAKVRVLAQSPRSLVRIIRRNVGRPSSGLSCRAEEQLRTMPGIELIPSMVGGRQEGKWRCPLPRWSFEEEKLLLCESVLSSLPRTSDAIGLIGADMECIFPEKHLLVSDGGKLAKLGRMLHGFQNRGDKCVIFSQFTSMLDILESFFNFHCFTYLRLDGAVKIEKRQPIINRFNTDPGIFIFLASTRAGGVGLNLTGANVVIFYDSDWNPSIDKQAMDRVHRIGQEKDVLVCRMITKDSLEETIWHKQLEKGYLTDAILDGGQFSVDMLRGLALDKSFTAKDLREVLGFGTDADTRPNVAADSDHVKPRAKQHAKPQQGAGAADDVDHQPRRGMDMSAVPPLLLWAASRVSHGHRRTHVQRGSTWFKLPKNSKASTYSGMVAASPDSVE